jgi:hypothetical protein
MFWIFLIGLDDNRLYAWNDSMEGFTACEIKWWIMGGNKGGRRWRERARRGAASFFGHG